MGYFEVCCKEEQTHCQCPNRCNCDDYFQHRCPKYTLIKDCLSIDWSVPSGQIQTIFRSSGNTYIYASGFVSLNNEASSSIIVRFYLNGVQAGAPLTVFNDSSVAFSLTRFDEITVECSGLPENEACEGEASLLIRTPMFINN